MKTFDGKINVTQKDIKEYKSLEKLKSYTQKYWRYMRSTKAKIIGCALINEVAGDTLKNIQQKAIKIYEKPKWRAVWKLL